MTNYVFKYRGQGVSPRDVKSKLRKQRNLIIVKATDNEIILSGPAMEIKHFGKELNGWFFTAVKPIPRPPVGAMRHKTVHRIK